MDYDQIYNRAYYEGNGADPTVDYLGELFHPDRTVRVYEWRGVCSIVRSLMPISQSTRWLDYGCGNGGLVRYCLQEFKCRALGVEDGWIRQEAVAHEIPVVNTGELEDLAQTFDVVTMIEVIEHIPDPVSALQQVRRFLRPGGLLFLTTGNAAPYRDRLLRWRYVVPEIHVSFFEPATLALAFNKAGFRPAFPGYLPGYTDVIRFKILKNLGVKQRSALEAGLPWRVLSRVADHKFAWSPLPVAWCLP